LIFELEMVAASQSGGIGMRHHGSKKAGKLSWQTQVLASLAEFDRANTPSQRMAALRELQSLFAGDGALKKVLRKCLALTKRAERLC
jgi:hypothetical protein